MAIDNVQELIFLGTYIGPGLSSPDSKMVLSLKNTENCDLFWTLGWEDGVENVIGCNSAQWCDWLYPIAPVEHISDYAVEYVPVLTEIGLNMLGKLRSTRLVSITPCDKKVASEGLTTVIKLIDEERELNLNLVSWSLERIRECTHDWLRKPKQGAGFSFPVPISLGRAVLSLNSLLSLRPGDGIVLPSAADIKQNKYWIYLNGTKISMSYLSEDSIGVDAVEHIIDDVLYEKNTIVSTLGDVKIPVVAELGVVRLSINELCNLEAGMVLSEQLIFADKVKLTVNGSCIGHARLIKATDDWILQVSELFTAGLASSGQSALDGTKKTDGQG